MADKETDPETLLAANTSDIQALCDLDEEPVPVYLKIEPETEDSPAGEEDINHHEMEIQRTNQTSGNTMVPIVAGSSSTITDNQIDFRPFMMNSKWTSGATGMLLEMYIANEDKFNSPNIKKKILWRQISEKLTDQGHCFDADKCERKFLNLKTTYRYTFDHNAQTGNQKKCAFYDQLDKIFRNQMARDLNSENTYANSADHVTSNNNDDSSIDSSENSFHSSNHGDNEGNYRPRVQAFQDSQRRAMVRRNSSQEHTSVSGVSPARINQRPRESQNISSNSLNDGGRRVYNEERSNPHINRTTIPHDQSRNMNYNSPHSHQNRNGNNNGPMTSSRNNVQTIDFSNHDSNVQNPSSSSATVRMSREEFELSRKRKRKQVELDNLLSTFEKYRQEQREREESRMATLKEMHDEEMKVINRFLDVIQQSIQSG